MKKVLLVGGAAALALATGSGVASAADYTSTYNQCDNGITLTARAPVTGSQIGIAPCQRKDAVSFFVGPNDYVIYYDSTGRVYRANGGPGGAWHNPGPTNITVKDIVLQ